MTVQVATIREQRPVVVREGVRIPIIVTGAPGPAGEAAGPATQFSELTGAPGDNAALAAALALKAPLVSPAFTNTPTAPTAAGGTNTTQIATTQFVTSAVASAVTGLMEIQGSTNCSGNPNYPAANKGDAYVVSTAGKIGGASGKSVDIGDWYVATADNAGGTEASVGTSWTVLEHNLGGVLLASNNLSDLGSAATARGNLGLGGLATLSSVGTAQIDADAVSYAKMQNVSAASRLLGRGSAGGAGDPEEITLGIGLSMSGSTLNTSVAPSTSGLYEARASALPLVSDFAWVNQGDATATDGVGALIVDAPTNGSTNWRILKKASPGGTFDVYARIKPTANFVGLQPRWAVILRDSGSGKFIAFGSGTNSSARIMIAERWNSPTSFSANTGITVSGTLADYPSWFRLHVTPTTITAYVSNNGWDWRLYGGSETIATFIGTVDEIGLGFRVDSITNHYAVSVFQTAAPS